MLRISFVLAMLVIGGIYGGLWGVWSALILAAIIMRILFGSAEAQPQERVQRAQDWNYNEVVSGTIKGHRDPTRPTEDDYAAMITDDYGKRRR